MKSISNYLSDYRDGLIEKDIFIKKMYQNYHSVLFQQSELLIDTNIKKIEITDDGIIMTTRDKKAKFFCIPGDFRIAPIEILNFKNYEYLELDFSQNLIENDHTILDIGSNIGWYAINIAISKPSTQVYCFEPIKKTYSFLKKNIKLNNLSNVTAFNFGLSNKNGIFDFYLYDEGSGNASAVNVSSHSNIKLEKCKVNTLDTITNNLKLKIDFIKCDVEGSELLVFKGGANSISIHKPIVFSEILRKWSSKFNYNPNEIFNFFRALGYKAYVIQNNVLVEFFKMDETTVETNFFFLHTQKHQKQIQKFLNT